MNRNECRQCEKEYAEGRLRAHRHAPPKPDQCMMPGCTATEKLVMDHDHDTHRFRGWICPNCNTGLGKFGDSIERLQAAIQYLNDSTKPISE